MAHHHDALIHTMVLASAADSEMTDAELARIGQTVRQLPVFADYDANDLPHAAEACAGLLQQDDGLDQVINGIRDALPMKLRETAYALACDIVAADGAATQEELRLLEFIRHRLELGRLVSAAIERGARARFATL